MEINCKPVRMYMDGGFDLMHYGHFNAIRQAKKMCDILVVGVISSKEITKCKGPPVMTLLERAELARACKWADEVIENVPYHPTINLINKLNCRYAAHGDDLIKNAKGEDSYQTFRDADRLKIFKRTYGASTTDIVGRLLLLTKEHHLDAT